MTTLVNVGDTLAGKYRVDRVLGIGGMGMVVAATHLELDQRVAIKFMLPDAAQNQFVAERFVREARSAVRLKSEHICRVTDYGKLDTGAPYIVMELMEGQDLAAVLVRRGVLPIIEAVDYLLQALEGLADAHANGIVHRDLKPGNLFVTATNDGAPLVKVLDFGISKSTIGGAATRTGDIMGSPAYMAPEQMMSAKNVDGRADVWAMGVILFQALTGRMPWESESLPALCMMVMNEAAPSPTMLRHDVPPELSGVVLRCIEKTREARFQNVAELAQALVPFGSEEARASARRVTRVLGKAMGTSGVVPEVAALPDDKSAPTRVERMPQGTPTPGPGTGPLGYGSGYGGSAPVSPVSTAAPVSRMGATSTLTSSAAEIQLPRDGATGATPAGRGRGVAIAAMVAIVGVIAVVVAVAATSGGGSGGTSGDTATTPAGPTAPATTQPAAQPAQPTQPATTQPATQPAAPPQNLVTVQPATTPTATTPPTTPPATTPPTLPVTQPTTTTPVPPAGPITSPSRLPAHPTTPQKVVTTPPSTTPNPPVTQPTTTPPPTQPPPTQPATQPPAGTGSGSGGSMWTHMQHDKTGH